MTVVLFLIILAILVLVHECGHFLAAKVSGIRVDEFGLGFPPRLIGKKFGETTYSLNAIPFGGFVKIFGENPDEESIEGPDKSRSIFHKPKSIQAFVLVAGVTCNVLFAWLLLSLGFMIGMPVPKDYSSSTIVQNSHVTVTNVQKGSPADKAGLKSGDILQKFTSGNDVAVPAAASDVGPFMAAHPNKPVTVEYMRGNQQEAVAVTPLTDIVAGDPGRAAIGVQIDEVGILRLSFFRSIAEGAKLAVYLVQETAVGLAQFLYQAVTGRAHLSDVSGPVGIAGVVGDAARLGFVYVLSFTAFISINLAVINLLPFPALDGGRLLITLLEKIKGSALNPKYVNAVNLVGFVVLILFMVVVTFHDIITLIHR